MNVMHPLDSMSLRSASPTPPTISASTSRGARSLPHSPGALGARLCENERIRVRCLFASISEMNARVDAQESPGRCWITRPGDRIYRAWGVPLGEAMGVWLDADQAIGRVEAR